MNNDIQEIVQPDIVISSEYSDDMTVHFSNLPRVATPLVTAAKSTLAQIEKMIASGMDKKDAIKAVAKANNVSKNEVYMLLVDKKA